MDPLRSSAGRGLNEQAPSDGGPGSVVLAIGRE